MTALSPRDGAGRRILASARLQALLLALRAGEQVVLLPLFLWAWGGAVYADWLCLLAGAAVAALLDLGLSRYGASMLHMSRSRGSPLRHARLFGLALTAAALLLAGVCAASALAGAMIAAGAAPRWIAPDAMSMGTAGTAFALLAPAMLIPGLHAALGGGLRAAGHYPAFLHGLVIARLAAIVSVAAVLALGGGPVAVAAAMLAVPAAIGTVMLVRAMSRHLPDTRWRPAWPAGAEARRHLRRLPPFAAIAVADTGTRHAPVLLLAMLGAGAGTLVTFAAVRTLTGLLRQGVQLAASSLAVETAEARARSGPDAARALAARALGRVWLPAAACGGALLGGGDLVLGIWTQGRIAPDGWLLGVLAAAAVLTVPFHIRAQGLAAVSRARPVARAGLAHLCAGAILGTALAGVLPPVHLAAAVMAGFGLAEVLVYALALPRSPRMAQAGAFAAAVALFLASWALAHAMSAIAASRLA